MAVAPDSSFKKRAKSLDILSPWIGERSNVSALNCNLVNQLIKSQRQEFEPVLICAILDRQTR